MPDRIQTTIERAAEVRGYGLFRGLDVTLRFLPAEENHGIVFQRTDLTDAADIPARVEHVVPEPRRTVLSRLGTRVEVVEHVMAALAGLQIDNCLVQLDAPEPPGCDGSAQAFSEALLNAGIVTQSATRPTLHVPTTIEVTTSSGAHVSAAPQPAEAGYTIGYDLDYGNSPVGRQSASYTITPEIFINEIAFARTFVLELEVAALRAMGFGQRTTTKDLLVFGSQGVIDNALRCPNECARHKLLDCIGDFALIGCDLAGAFHADRSGHRANHDLIRRLKVMASMSGTDEVSLESESPPEPPQRRIA
ncbi:UDP-3-O-[3-hydroxymyristoyl] N-acetylglucosamine deacetylase [Maioricimonas rarisocia]|uniref:UDP-3-O-acyl-N-acetylglucosamine deacetylase n=1 Tax=Maioricimonas rarisocia TaxID=2528026 RepID=A0A517ZD42_9PLAN|nr:UDP-3-O-acyl-N-acetylglucosamine deacetylase [Maioricimonas rarisocia]QDU40379.1 UDP-3-O-[3-hydroxymyristoyl] N-acetylglucosamine deacetylase [Maioricimonas rarisocia]